MGSIQDEWASDAAEILGEIPKAVSARKGTADPVSFQVLMTEPLVQQDLETGGFLNSTSFDMKFLRTDLVAHPGVVAYGSVITYNNAQYRVVAINDRPPSAWVIVKVVTKVASS